MCCGAMKVCFSIEPKTLALLNQYSLEICSQIIETRKKLSGRSLKTRIPPHATDVGTRIITVVSGKLFWGNGDAVNPDEEVVYLPGDVLVTPAMAMHWLTAREGDILLQATLLNDSALIPEIQRQLV